MRLLKTKRSHGRRKADHNSHRVAMRYNELRRWGGAMVIGSLIAGASIAYAANKLTASNELSNLPECGLTTTMPGTLCYAIEPAVSAANDQTGCVDDEDEPDSPEFTSEVTSA